MGSPLSSTGVPRMDAPREAREGVAPSSPRRSGWWPRTRRRRRVPDAYRKGVLLTFVLSLGVSVLLVAKLGGTRTGELNDSFTDHIRHVEETWTFLHKGLHVYRGNLRAVAYTQYPHFDMPGVGVPWPDMPVVYPVGLFAFFLPPTLAGAHLPLSTPELLKWIVVYIVVATHLGLLAVAFSLRGSPGRVPLLTGIWLFFLGMCLHGFYDGVWVGLGAMSVAALSERRPRASLLWFAAATALSLKAVTLVPVGAWAFFALFRVRGSLWTKVAAALSAVLAGVHACWIVAVTFRYIPPPGSPTYEAAKSPLLPIGMMGAFVIVAGVLVACLAFVYSGALVALSVLVATALTIQHAGHFWHGAILIPAALLPGGLPTERNPRLSREVVMMWMFVFWELPFVTPLGKTLSFVLERIPWN
jgi:hypothetical protein